MLKTCKFSVYQAVQMKRDKAVRKQQESSQNKFINNTKG